MGLFPASEQRADQVKEGDQPEGGKESERPSPGRAHPCHLRAIHDLGRTPTLMDDVQRVVLLALSPDEVSLVRDAVVELNSRASRDELRDRCHSLLTRLPTERTRKTGEPGSES